MHLRAQGCVNVHGAALLPIVVQRAIVVKTEDEAAAIIAGLNAGKPFSSFVAKSIDENSKNDN